MSAAPPEHPGEKNPVEGGADRAGEASKKQRSGLDLRVLAALVVIVVIAGGIALLTVGSGSSTPAPGTAEAKPSAFHAAGMFSPPRPAPPLALHNYLGQPVNIDSYRGKSVLVTFLYTNCPDVCPLITSNLRVAQNLMGSKESARVQIIAVSVDPHGDTPKAVAAFLARHGMTGRMQYLIGSAHELGRVWEAWGVGSQQDSSQPQFVNHTGIIYGISASGKQTAFYSPEFKPADIAHDVPLLASE
ncbi:MAG TPA: SCO family protein [Solirubrobacteraceae bacterium]|jgi:protein SCO1/2